MMLSAAFLGLFSPKRCNEQAKRQARQPEQRWLSACRYMVSLPLLIIQSKWSRTVPVRAISGLLSPLQSPLEREQARGLPLRESMLGQKLQREPGAFPM